MKKVWAIVLTLAMLLSLAPTGAFAQEVSASAIEGEGDVVETDYCGDDVTWTLYESGLLLISGTGDMDNWNFWDVSAPWIGYSDQIAKVVIEEGVTSIGMNAFCSEDSYYDYNDHFYSALTEIVIPNTVTTVQTNGISGLDVLETITIPASLTTLVGAAFNNNYALKQYVVDEANPVFQAVGGVLFSKDGKTLISYPIGSEATSYEIPQGTETIDAYAFSQCSNLRDVVFNEELIFIDDEAFQSCTGLTSLELPDSVKELGGGAFQECRNLAEISLPAGMTRIGGLAFDATAYYNDFENWTDDCVLYLGNYLLDTEYAPIEADWQDWKEKEGTLIVREGTTLIADEAADMMSIDGVEFNEGLQHIGFCAFGWSDYIAEVSLPDSLLTLGDWAFYNCPMLTDVYIGNNLQYIGHDVLGETPYTEAANHENGVLYYGPYVLGFNSALPRDVVLRDGTTLIAERAFWKEDGSLNTSDYGASMDSIAFPESLTTICDGAFYSCMNLKTLTVPASVTYIGDQAFGWIKGYDLDIDEETFEPMTDVTVEGYNDTAAEAYAARYGIPFVSLDAPPPEVDEVYGTVISAGACGMDVSWKAYDSGALVITGEGEMDDFGDDAWRGLPITRIVIDDGVTTIGRFAFEGCDSAETIEIGRDVSYIGQYALRCKNLQRFTVSEDNAYYAVSDGVLFNADYSELLRYPPKKAGTSYAVPHGVYALADGAFENCADLTAVTFTDTTTSFGYYAFAESGLTSIVLPEYMTILEGSALRDCLALTSVFIPHRVKEIGYAALDGCFNLTDVYYESSQEDARQLFIYDGNDVLSNVQWHYDICGNNPAKVHNYTPATCFEPKTCRDCGLEIGTSLGHSLLEGWSFDNDAHWRECVRCGGMSDIESHDLDEGEVIQEPTCGEYGIKMYICRICTGSVSEFLPKTSAHTYTDSCDSTCNECGEPRAAGHDYKAATCTEPETCRKCGDTRDDKLGHFYSVPCDTQCDRCGETRVVTHDYVAASCSSPKYCRECGTIFGGELGHTYSHDCDKTCNRCGVSRTTSHTYESVVTKATLTKDGKIDYRCTKCGYVSSKPKAISRPTSFTLSTTSYAYNGSVKTPNVTVKDAAGKTLVKNTDYTVSYASGRKNAGTYKVTVTMKGKYSGTKTLTFKINPIDVSKCSVKLSTTAYTYDGKVKAPSVVVKNAGGTTLKKDTHYTVTYATGRKNVGTYKVTVKMKGNYGGTKTLTFKINPPKTTVAKLSPAKTSMTVYVSRKSSAAVTGYQIQYATNKDFTNAKTKWITNYNTGSATLTGLKSKTTQFVRVRTYKKVGSTTYYSGWSSIAYMKTK